jgi:Ca2+-binding RTX toxin-like protein
MRRITLLLAAMGTALLLSAGLALAATYDCFAGRACIGTDGPDTLIGTSSWDYMDGRQGDDRLFGNERGDEMSGDAWDAPVNGTSTDGDDLLRGGPSWDFMAGYGGDDELYGGLGGDFIFAEEASANGGEDTVYGSKGNDYIEARDETKDAIDCGRGNTDVAFFDKGGIDTVSDNCEYRNEWPDFEEPSSAAASSSAADKVGAKKLDALRAR